MFAPIPALAQFSAPVEEVAVAADTVIANAQIYTPQGWATHMAIASGAIVAVGSQEDVARHLVTETQVIDLAGQMVMPGLHDMHVHPSGAGMARERCMIPQGTAGNDALAFIAECAARADAGAWIEGGGWDTASFGDTPPTRQMLDAIATDRPIFLRDISGHSAWANSHALALAGITRDTPDPDGGIIERDASGEATGILRESASGLVALKIPAGSLASTIGALEWATNEMLSHGITAYDDAGVFRRTAEAYAALADDNRLKIRVRGCLWGGDPRLIADRMLFARPRFSPTCVKLVLDGVPTDGHTAAMLQPYMPGSGGHGDESDLGLLMIPQEDLNRQLVAFDAAGLTVKMHAAGDRAVRAGITAIEAARGANPTGGNLHNVGHNSFVAPEDFERARAADVTLEFSPYIWFENPIIPDIRNAVGAPRLERWTPVKDSLDAGVLTVAGSDWNVVPSVNPWIAIETLVTREAPGGGSAPLGAAERITLEQALNIFTRQAARSRNFDHATGTLEEGKLADFIVLDRNIFAIPATQIHQTRVIMTYIEGELVYMR